VALSTDYIQITGAEFPDPIALRNMDYELPHAHASNAAEELEGLQATADALLLEIDAAIAAYSASIDRGLALAGEMRQLADAVDGGMADARAEFDKWW